MTIHLIPVRYPLQRIIHTAADSYVERHGILVAMETSGVVGWGEALPVPGWFHGDASSVEKSLHKWLEDTADNEPSRYEQDGPLPNHAVAAAAVDCARLDVAGRRTGVPLFRLLTKSSSPLIDQARGGEPKILVNALIGVGSAREAANRAAQAAEDGFSTVKVKVAADHISQDVERLDAIRRAAGPDMRIRLDANQGWNADEAPDAIARLAEFDIEYIEEPCASLKTIGTMRHTTPIPLYLDEHVRTATNAHQVIMSGFADGIVLKPASLGTLSTSVQLAERAHHAEMGVTVTNVLDSGIGTLAAMHVAAAINAPLNACGFATGELFSAAPLQPPPVDGGMVRVPTTPGLGAQPELSSEFVTENLAE